MDTIHEDLNTAEDANKRNQLVMPSETKLIRMNEQQIVELYMQAFLQFNQSIIVDLMYG